MRELTSRADLLYTLANVPAYRYAGVASSLGYLAPEQPILNDSPIATEPLANQAVQVLPQPQATAQHFNTVRLPHHTPVYWAVQTCEPAPQKDTSLAQKDWPAVKEKDMQRKQKQHRPLRNAGQWQNLWDQALDGKRASRQIQLKAVLKRLVQAKPLDKLPRQPRRSFNRPVVLLFERSQALKPIWDDMRDAWASLQRLQGEHMQAYYCTGDPHGEWRYFDRRSGQGAANIHCIPRGAQCVLIGAFGALQTGSISPAWANMLAYLKEQGHTLSLVSVCPIQQNRLPVFDLAPLRQTQQHAAQHLAILLTALARCYVLDIEQLRQLRQSLPGMSVTTELRAWQHTDVEHGDIYLQIEENQQTHWRNHTLEPAWQDKVAQACEACLETSPPLLQEAARLLNDLENQPSPKDYPKLQVLGKEVEQQRREGDKSSHPQIVLRSLLTAARLLSASKPHPDWGKFLSEAQRVALQQGQVTPLQAQYLDELPDTPQYLHQQDRELHFMPMLRWASLIELQGQVYCKQTGRIEQHALPNQHASIDIQDRHWRYQLQKHSKPNWANRIWRDSHGLFAAHEAGLIMQLSEANPDRPQAQWHIVEQPWQWADKVGVDEKGLWAEFSVQPMGVLNVFRKQGVRHRLRWIPAGSFDMGSPETEEGRSDGEVLHHVTLTQGYWLGETSVTQALWKAVMGKNPSHHQDDELPVEKVSWDDCQQFVKKLSVQLPGLHIRLPTEAEWEYACRAGTQTAYWWGNKMDDEYANNGYETKVEENYPMNNFGLRSMSGNVLEWCQDWYSHYSEQAVINPTGSEVSEGCVLRGNSWFDGARFLRAATRHALHPRVIGRGAGLRLAGSFGL